MALVELRNLGKHYEGRDRRRDVLTGLSAEIHAGEFVVLVGRSGSGKSTLLNLIGGLDRPSTGDVLINGQSLTALDQEALSQLRRHRVGYVFQFFNLIPTLTVGENLLLPLELIGVTGAGATDEPGIVLADEPTGNLDLATARDVLRLLDDLCRASGTTLIMATHSQEVIGLADRVLTILDGELVPIDESADS